MREDRVFIIRQTIDKVTRMLSGQNVRVTQRGMRAYVSYDRRDGSIDHVNIPYLPDNADEALINAVQGFLDHEVAHILISDSKVLAEGARMGKTIAHMHNIIEDTFIERKMAERFRGSQYNLDRVGEFVIESSFEPEYRDALAAKDKNALFRALLCPAMRAWAGHEVFAAWMKDKWDDFPNRRALAFAESELPHLESSAECLDLACKIVAMLTPPPPPPTGKPEKGDQDKNEGEKDESDDEGDGAEGDENDDDGDSGKSAPNKEGDDKSDEGEGDAEDEKPGKSKGDGDDESGDDESGDGEGDGEGDDESGDDEGDDEGDGKGADESGADESDGDESDGDESDGDGSDGDGDEGDEVAGEKGSGDSESDKDGDGDEGGEDAPTSGQQSAGEQGDVEDGDAEAGEDGNEDDDYTNEGKESDAGLVIEIDLDEAMAEGHDVQRSLAQKIEEMTIRSASSKNVWTVYSEEWDTNKIYTPHAWQDRWLSMMERSTDGIIGPMAKQLERLILAKNRTVYQPGLRRGKLNPSALHRLASGDDRLFRKKQEIKGKNTAIRLLVDLSGSMSGSKILTAMQSAYALAAMLERVGVACCVSGFATGVSISSLARAKDADHFRDYVLKMGAPSRDDTLVHVTFKSWDERMNTEVRKRFAAMPHDRTIMTANCDYESVLAAGRDLAMRKEERRILIVLSDGFPAFTGNIALGNRLLKKTVKEFEAQGMEVIGIGIESTAVQGFYPKNVVMRSVSELPALLVGEMRKILV